MRADEERPLRRRPAHDLARALEDVLLGEARLQLAPDMDPLDQRAGLVPARPAGGERRVEVEVAVDERRRGEPPFRIDDLRAVDIEVRAIRANLPPSIPTSASGSSTWGSRAEFARIGPDLDVDRSELVDAGAAASPPLVDSTSTWTRR